MFFRIISYLKFLSKSTNQHGVHSPFVYDLVTRCFYNKKKKPSYLSISEILKKEGRETYLKPKTTRLLNRIIPYFEYHNVYIPENIPAVVKKVLIVDNPIIISGDTKSQESFDLLYVDLNLQTIEEIFQLINLTHNDSLLVINNINSSSTNRDYWEAMQKNDQVKVTIDTFTLGFVFFRKEQVKEHFAIRL